MEAAIIGVAFRFPGANDAEAYWANIEQRKTSIIEIPGERWDWRSMWGDPKLEVNKSNSRWGGFIDHVDAFDHEFFGLLPKVVQNMDPQQRIMLELAWSCIESAGIAPTTLRGRGVGVFTGVTHHDYKELLASAKVAIEPYHYTGTATVVVPNRISHMFGLRGPSVPIDTACSSSLNAIHAAIQSFERDECEMALAGGISLILNPARHISISKMGTLSPTGSCKTLDDRADGYVRGEGAGFFLLKPLERAMMDGDRIHGVIKGSAINHCGQTHTLSYPSSDAQADVIVAAHERAGVPVSSVNYVELHGTGTAKGDPIEFEGLLKAYTRLAANQGIALDAPYCGLSSVKTNIGHLEAAAGMAGIVKVLLAFKNRRIPGFHDFKKLNSRVTIEGTPFYILDQTMPWRPVDEGTPLRAGISSFGFGGTNAHIVLEEPPKRAIPTKFRRRSGKPPPCLIALSAKTADALNRRRNDLLDWLRGDAGEHTLHEISRELLIGRDHFPHRFACVVDDLPDLVEALTADAGVATGDDSIIDVQKHAIDGELLLSQLKSTKKSMYLEGLVQLAAHYRSGMDLEWSRLFSDESGSRPDLPTYPFARTRFWLPATRVDEADAIGSGAESGPRLHPLLHSNATVVDRRRFVSKFDGNEFFLADHVIQGQRMLSGVAYLEMVRAALQHVLVECDADVPACTARFSDVVWLRPFIATEAPAVLQMELVDETPANGGEIQDKEFEFVVSSIADGAHAQIHCKGTVMAIAGRDSPMIDLVELERRQVRDVCAFDLISASLASQGIVYGPGHSALRELRYGRNDGIGIIEMPPFLVAGAKDYVFHPSIADAALQAAVVFLSVSANDGGGAIRAEIPFALDMLEIYGAPTDAAYAYVRRSGGSHIVEASEAKLDVDIIDADGHVCATIRGLSVRALNGAVVAAAVVGASLSPAMLEVPALLRDSLYVPAWTPRRAVRDDTAISQLVVVGDSADVAWAEAWLKRSPRFASTRVERIVLADDGSQSDEVSQVVRPGIIDDYTAAVAALAAKGGGLEHVLLLPSRANNGEAVARIEASAGHVFALAKTMMRGTKKTRFVQLAGAGDDAVEYLGLSGFFKTLRIEKPAYSGCIVECGLTESNEWQLADIVADALLEDNDAVDVRYRAAVREIRTFSAVAASTPKPAAGTAAAFREGGVYLLTGGLGAIGRIVAAHLCTSYRAKVFLTGRSEPTGAQRAAMAALATGGGEVSYRVCDVANRDDVQRVVAAIRSAGHRLNGVLHSAGVIEDGFVLRKTPEEFARVVAPKTLGTWNLDLATRDEPLDMFVLFSSVAGVLGNVGQCDYAYGNAFEDAFVHEREALRARGERVGKSLSINWPFWLNGGMRLGEAEIEAVRRSFGIVPLLDAQGIDALEYALAQPHPQMVVMHGDVARIREVLGTIPAETDAVAATQKVAVEDSSGWHPLIAGFFAELFAKQLQISADFDLKKSFRDYGFDSVIMIELIAVMEKTFGTLPKTLFFEYPTLDGLAAYFIENHVDSCAGIVASASVSSAAPKDAAPPALSLMPVTVPTRRAVAYGTNAGSRSQSVDDDIAIIGLAGRYPKADTLEAFWDNLKSGRDCVEEIPNARHDLSEGFQFQPGEPVQGKSYAKWGGLLSDVDRFDPLFFNISPKEADSIDPNERLFLEIASWTIEDAGYTPETLCARRGFKDNPVGVYVGVMWGDHQLHGVDGERETWVAPQSFYWSIANRVSHQFDFSGPSLAVDTACSSSLTAIHLACQAIRQGEIDVAIAGAVNLSLHPNKYNLLSNLHFLSKDGRCRSFGSDGTGYVPGEGVGAVLLKSLPAARADGDHIYGVIRGSSINHGGKSAGFTVPNAKRQADLIQEALSVAGVDPQHLSYLEAHGTGTKLGDPIEINALTKAFGHAPAQFCPIGSCKSNLGHLEAAAGIAALTKVLLQMKYRMLVPSIHSDTLNPFIEFDRSPFYVQRVLRDWRPPTVETAPSKSGEPVLRELPRLAGISSFGAGGANGHLIIEEYRDGEMPRSTAAEGRPVLIVLSARKDLALRETVTRMAAFVSTHPETDLRDLAYTLQVGRIPMEHRLAIVVASNDELVSKLRAYGNDIPRRADCVVGHCDNARRDGTLAARQTVLNLALAEKVAAPAWSSIGQAWVDGVTVDWRSLYAPGTRRRLPLPGYPYQRQRYWIDKPATIAKTGRLHPVIDANVSTLDAQTFQKRLHPEEFFLRDHRLGDNRVLPGVVYLEMAVQAGLLARPGLAVRSITDIEWHRPIMLRETTKSVDIALMPEGSGVAFEIRDSGDDAPVIYAHGRLRYDSAGMPRPATKDHAPMDLAAVTARCKALAPAQVEDSFARMGFAFGHGFRVFAALHYAADEALAHLRLPQIAECRPEAFVLHPSLLDGAFRTVLGIGGLHPERGELKVPVALGVIEILHRVQADCFVYARRISSDPVNGRERFDIQLLDAEGRVLVRIERLTVQPAPQLALAAKPAPAAARVVTGAAKARPAVVEFIKGIVSEATRIPAGEIDPTQPFGNYGIDSVMIVKLTSKLQDAFGEVSKTLFFEFLEIDGLADHLLEAFPEGAQRLAGNMVAQTPSAMAQPELKIDTADAVDGDAVDKCAHLYALMKQALGAAAVDCLPETPIAEWPLDPITATILIHRLSQDFEQVDAHAPYRFAKLAEWAETLRWKASRALPPINANGTTARLAAFARRAGRTLQRGDHCATGFEDVAIVGLSGRYPDANDLLSFWRNLSTGRDSISEIPASRWDHSRFFNPDRSCKGTVYSKWGGFIDGVDQFDAGFFNLSARESEITDPQERLFLQIAWECVEDACYTRQSLLGRSVGVFVGVMWGNYAQIDVSDEQLKSGRPCPPFSSIANRVSYFMNFNGPSLAIDTMCSSSLTAIHLSCRAIQNGDCDLAIAGGVNLILHPNKYLQLSSAQFLSSDGRCRAFGTGGDGYVPGEGVGAVLLKRLSEAIDHGDHVYGVIKATSLNHGGKTNGYTVPNQVAQTNVIGKALSLAGWDPNSIDYIEAHGTGTSLGDPIEIAGLSRAFSAATAEVAGPDAVARIEPQRCRIGSLKSNVGHLESAAAIAGLTKILLQFRHDAIAPSLHSQALNPNIEFARTPFRVVQTREPWLPVSGGLPRRAGLSSFGAGGSNAHCLVEAFPRRLPSAAHAARPVLFVLSADSEERLSRYVDRVIAFLERGGDQDIGLDMVALAWSSQIGREAMDERIAVVTSDVSGLLASLRDYRAGSASTNLIRGTLRKHSEKLESVVDDAEKDALIRSLIGSGRLQQLARAWVSMLDIDWSLYSALLYPATDSATIPRRMPFPTMPFMTQRYWVEEKPAGSAAIDVLHPLIDRNESTLSVQRYRKRFDGSEFYLRDHIVHTDRDRKILPGVAYLEMARAAGDMAAGNHWRVDRIRNLVWMRPFEIVGAPDGLAISMNATDDSLGFVISRDSDGVTCVEGELGFRQADAPSAEEWLDIAAIRAEGALIEPGCEEIYAGFRRMGFHFGPAFQVTRARYRVDGGALCHLRLPEHLRAGLGEYGLHPSLMDAALRAGLAVDAGGNSESRVPIIPFSLDELEFHHPLVEECFVHVVRSPGAYDRAASDVPVSGNEATTHKYDFVVTDADGMVLVKLRGFTGRPLIKQPPASARVLQYFDYEWLPEAIGDRAAAAEAESTGQTVWVVGASPATLAAELRACLPPQAHVVPVVHAGSGATSEADNASAKIDSYSSESVRAIFSQARDDGQLPTHILCCDGESIPGAASAQGFDAESLHRGIQLIRQLFIALEGTSPGAHVRLLYAYQADERQPQPQYDAIFGYARSLLTVNHRVELSTLRYDRFDAVESARIFAAEMMTGSGFGAEEIAYRNGRRFRRNLHSVEMDPIASADEVGSHDFKDGCAYLITGGVGKLGLSIARHIAEHCRCHLILSGRSATLSDSQCSALEELRGLGATVSYRNADISRRGDVEALIAWIERGGEGLHGVIHCAGVASDRSIMMLDDREFTEIMAPKIDGLILLDAATAHLPLDFFVNFSSVSALLGDLGACAYAVGNRFMDSHAQWREALRAQNRRHGRSVSINWPLWATGGMEISGSEATVFGFSGMQSLGEQEGLESFGRIMRSGHDHVLVSVGDPQRVARTLRLGESRILPLEKMRSTVPEITSFAPKAQKSASEDLQALAETYVKERMATITRIRAETINSDMSFEKYGMDSVLLLELHAALREDFRDLPKTALFEYDTTARMAKYLIQSDVDSVRRCVGAIAAKTIPVTSSAPGAAEATGVAPSQQPVVTKNAPVKSLLGRDSGAMFKRSAEHGRSEDAIAVIGIAGEFPASADVAQFWANLRDGKDCLTRIPDERGFASALNRFRSRSGRHIPDKGGFIDSVDLFDTKLFRMSQTEADKADPQLRVLLRTAWRAVENAAYTPEDLSSARVGVFVGAMNEDFTWIAAEYQARAAEYIGPGSVSSELSNRLSFLMNFCGPSITVSTACSASLSAVHLARQSILVGDCEVALAGGVNLSLHHSKYLLLQDMNVLSSDGHERTFDDAADGLVPGEGVGVVVLKRLSRAIEDGDHIHGVIRGSSISHSGTGAGQFLPNIRVMEETAARCIREAGLSAEDVTYLETHGTGTELGDPIELRALANALRQTSAATGFCAIGTKANMGHMEAASGIGSLIKVLLSMRHGQLAPCAKLNKINSNFDHTQSPFSFPRLLETWARNARGTHVAGINSYGMGGSNAFVVVESAPNTVVRADTVPNSPMLFVLSARSEVGLRDYAAAFANMVRTDSEQGLSWLADLAYSTQIGRIASNYRLAIVVGDIHGLLDALQSYLDGGTRLPACMHAGKSEDPTSEDLLRLIAGDAGTHFVDALIDSKQLDRIAALWVRGCRIDWARLHHGAVRRRMAFPGIPFELSSCDIRNMIASCPAASNPVAVVEINESEPDPEDTRAEATGWCRLAALCARDNAISDVSAKVDLRQDDAPDADGRRRNYWVEHLGAGDDTAIELSKKMPLDAAEVAVAHEIERDIHCVSELVESELVCTLQAFGARHGIAIETMITAAWAILVNRHTKARYSQFGLLGAVTGTEDLLPVRVKTVVRLKILEWLHELQADLVRKHLYASAPIKTISEWVGAEELYDSVVVFDLARVAVDTDVEGQPMKILVSEAHSDVLRPSMELVAMTDGDTLELSLIYRAAAPDHGIASVFLQQLKILLEGIACNPEKTPSALGMRTKTESRDSFWRTMESVVE